MDMIAVDDEFGVTASEFAHLWNMSADHASVAVARPHAGRLDRFDPGTVVDAALGAGLPGHRRCRQRPLRPDASRGTSSRR